MKNKHVCFMTAMGLAVMCVGFSACSDDDNPGAAQESASNAIRFAANTEAATRAGDITTNNLKEFNVYAYTGTDDVPVLFMDNVTVSKNGSNTWTYSPVKFWPAKETVDFYAFAPKTWVGAGGPLKPVTYDNGYTGGFGQVDLVYAVSPDLSGNAGVPNAQVVFNFRHALSKVTLKLSSTNTDLRVEVSNIVLANIMTRGNFHFPSLSTSGAMTDDNIGKWTDQNTAYNYVLHMAQALDDVMILTTTPTEPTTTTFGLGDAEYMIPQVLTWRSNGMNSDTYIGVMCSVYDAKSNEKLWPNANTPEENIVEGHTRGDGILKFPLSTSKFSAWSPGCHYIYNLVINSNEEMGAIEFGNPTVDTFVEVTTNYE